jgi:hypothetical protein
MSEIKTVTVDELVAMLTKYSPDTKIYISRDSEGNGFGTLSANGLGVEECPQDNAIALFPMQEHLEYDEIFPKTYEEEENDHA